MCNTYLFKEVRMYYKIDFNQILKVCSFGYEHLSEKRKHPTRTVSEYIFYIITSGTLCLLLNGEEIRLHKGDCMLFHPGETQAVPEISHCEYYWCHFESDNGITHLQISDSACKERIKEKHLRSRETKLYTTEAYSFCFVYLKKCFHIKDMAIYDYVTAAFQKNPFTPEARNPERRFQHSAMLSDIFFRLEGCEDRNETHYLAHRLTKFVERNYNKNLSASEIEDAFSLGIDHLNRILKKAVGTSILKYRNALRIEAAKKKITESTVPFSEIATENGFENYPYFSRLFKRETGFSPEEYRKSAKGDVTL